MYKRQEKMFAEQEQFRDWLLSQPPAEILNHAYEYTVRELSLIHILITRPKEDGNGYDVIAGQRRVRASELAGINTVPAFVLP